MKTKQEVWDEVLRRGFCVNDGVAVQVLIDVLDFCGVFGEGATEDGEADDMAAKLARYRTAHARLGLKIGAERDRAIRKRGKADDARREVYAELHKAHAELARCQGDLEVTHHQQQAAIDDACENVRAHERVKLEAARAGFEAVRLKLEEAVNQLGIERDKDKRHMAGTGLERAVDIIEVLVDTDACRLDHHGACQTHGCTRPCIMPLAIAWLVEQGRGRG